MKEIVLGFAGGELVVEVKDGGGRIARSTLGRATCAACGEAKCRFDCVAAREQFARDAHDSDVAVGMMYNAGLDVLESLVLAHAIAGVDVTSLEYRAGLDVAADWIGNHHT